MWIRTRVQNNVAFNINHVLKLYFSNTYHHIPSQNAVYHAPYTISIFGVYANRKASPDEHDDMKEKSEILAQKTQCFEDC